MNTLDSKPSYGIIQYTKNPEPENVKGLTITEAYFSLIKSMIGTGILYFPRAFYLGGAFYGSCVCILVAFFSYRCMIWLSEIHTNFPGTYAEISEKANGKLGYYMVELMIFASQIGCGLVGIGFLLVNSKKSLETLEVSTNFYVLAILITLALTPLCLYRTLREQTWAFIIADIIIITNALVIGIYSCTQAGSFKNLEMINPKSMIFPLGTSVYGFEGIALTVPIKSEMKKQGEFDTALAYMMGTVTIIIIWFANMNVYAYGDDLNDLVTLNLPNTNWVAIMIICYIIAILFSVPLALYPAFQIIDKTLELGRISSSFMKIILIPMLVAIGLITKDYLGLCVSVIGGLCCAPLAFLIPAHIKLKLDARTNRERYECYLMMFLGVLFGAAAILVIIF